MKRPISYGRQAIDKDDVGSVVDVLGSEMLTQGPRVTEFEEVLASYTGARYAVCCSSGTAALHLSCLAAGLGTGDQVITSPNTFLASANCVLYVGAIPRFADIDPDTFNISTLEIERCIEASDGQVKAIIPVHFAGFPSDMEEIAEISAKHGLTVIEDACHALGASWRSHDGEWHKVGSSSHSALTVFSFHPVKSITTGEGGAITTNDKTLYEHLKTLRAHGVQRDPAKTKAEPWLYEMRTLGYNYRLSDIHCALGISQMKKLDGFIERRAAIAALYTELFSNHSFIKTPPVSEGKKSAHHLYPLRISFDSLGVDKGAWFKSMRELGVALQVHYIPVHLQPFYREKLGGTEGSYPNAEGFYASEVSLPIYPGLTDEQVRGVAEAVLTTLESASSVSASGKV